MSDLPDEEKPLKLWYMRDSHTFASLPLDEEGAIAKLRSEFIDHKQTYGMLCSNQYPEVVHAGKVWDEFEPQARKWVRSAINHASVQMRIRTKKAIGL